MTTPTSIIQSMSIFSALTPETIQALSRRSFLNNLPLGYTFRIEGMPADACYFILSGDIRVQRMNRDGRIQVLSRLTAGAPININSILLPEKTNLASVETLSETSLLVIPDEDFTYLTEHHPDFSTLLLKIFAARMAKMTELAAGLSLYSVRARLAKFLIKLAEQPKSVEGWTQDEIAAYIGTVRDVVGRLLRDFEENGLIKRDRQKIILLDRTRLTAEAEMQKPY